MLHEDVEFLAFSKALLANSLLGPQVRELSMYISWQESAWCSWDNNPCIGFYDPFPLQAVRTLSNIRSAVYEHDGGEFVYDALVPFLRELAARSSLRTLELGCITFLRPGDIADILVGAPHLTRLCVNTCVYYDYERSGIVLPLEDSRMAPQYCRDLRAVVVSARANPAWSSVSASLEPMQFTDNENMDSLLDMLPAHCTITHLTLGPIWREPDPFFRPAYTDEHQNQFRGESC